LFDTCPWTKSVDFICQLTLLFISDRPSLALELPSASKRLASFNVDQLPTKIWVNCARKSTSVGQEGISRLEKRCDLLISTLRNYVARMGGQLELVVRFPDRPAIRGGKTWRNWTWQQRRPRHRRRILSGLYRDQYTPDPRRIGQREIVASYLGRILKRLY
jgi:hypothetical protein